MTERIAFGTPRTTIGANLGFEATLEDPAANLRGNLDRAKSKHVVFGLTAAKF